MAEDDPLAAASATILNQAVDRIKKHGLFRSEHETYGILAEEVEEFFEVVRENGKKKGTVEHYERLFAEAVDVAMVAMVAAAQALAARTACKTQDPAVV